jgi:hypothetical protein
VSAVPDEPVIVRNLNPHLLALDDVRTRDELPAWWRAASGVLDDWLRRAHGVTTSDNELGWLLALWDAEGYVLIPPDPADKAEGYATALGE